MEVFSRQQSTTDFALQYCKDFKSWLRDYITAIKHGRWHPFSPTERKVREATRNEAWGPTGTQLNEISEASYDDDDCRIIMAVIEARLKYPAEKWRNVYKGLQVLEFLLRRGSELCIDLSRQDLREQLELLRDFHFIDADMKDYGINVRVRSEAIYKLLYDSEQLQQERSKIKVSNQKYHGYSREDIANGRNKKEEKEIRANSWTDGIPGTEKPKLEKLNDDRDVKPIAKDQRGAGEMKGVSLEQNKKHIEMLKGLLSREENRTCADCIGGMRPTWASINCGTFICMKCAGIHRGLGVHISKVRSCTLDTWLPDQVEFMSCTGNKKANAYWEGMLNKDLKPRSEDMRLADFIRRKYVEKVFAKGTWPPAPEASENRQTDAGNASTSTTNISVNKLQYQVKVEEPEIDLLNFEDDAFDLSPPKEIKNESSSFLSSAPPGTPYYNKPSYSTNPFELPSSSKEPQWSSVKKGGGASASVAANPQGKKDLYGIDNDTLRSLTKNSQYKYNAILGNTDESQKTKYGGFSFPSMNFSFFGIPRGDIIITKELNLDDLESLSETASVASKSYAPSVASHPVSRLQEIEEDEQEISPANFGHKSSVFQTNRETMIQKSNTNISKIQLRQDSVPLGGFEDDAFSVMATMDRNRKDQFIAVPNPVSVPLSVTGTETSFSLLDALVIPTQNKSSNTASVDPFSVLNLQPLINLDDTGTQPVTLSQISGISSNSSVKSQNSGISKLNAGIRISPPPPPQLPSATAMTFSVKDNIDLISFNQIEALRIGSLKKVLKNPARPDVGQSQKMMS